MAIRYLTAGESHGPALCAIAEGFPAGLSLDLARVDAELARRQKGYGRGGRMQIETDRAEFLSGIRGGLTLGTPIALVVWNKDHENWKDLMSPAARGGPRFTRPRPGHADLPGVQKYGFDDARDALERASARSTAATVALGAFARQLLGRFCIEVCSRVTAIGERSVRGEVPPTAGEQAAVEASDVRTADPALAQAWRDIVDRERARGGSIGGTFEVWATGLPPGLGTYAHPDRRLDGRLAGALCAIPAIRAVELGEGSRVDLPGDRFHDAIQHSPDRGFHRATNRAGGIEGGMTNGEPVCVRASMKPIPTMTTPLGTVDIDTREPAMARYERSDVCAVPAASVVGEAVVCWELAAVFVEKFGGDAIVDVEKAVAAYGARIR
jgi:chorismate synthase